MTPHYTSLPFGCRSLAVIALAFAGAASLVSCASHPARAADSFPATEGMEKRPAGKGVLKRFPSQPADPVEEEQEDAEEEATAPTPSPSPTRAAKSKRKAKGKASARKKVPTAEDASTGDTETAAPSETPKPKTKSAGARGKKKKKAPSATPTVAAANLPPIFREIEDKYAKAQTLVAEFTQTNTSAVTQQVKKTSGQIMVKRPNRIRWETLKPDMNLLVSDGKTFWFYTPPFDADENGQLIVRKSSEVQSQLANALLSGSFSAAKDMDIKPVSASQYTLIPHGKSGGTVEKAVLEIDPNEKLIKKVILEHRGGNKSEITLSKIELGKELDDSMFKFEAPPKTDRVDK